LAEGKGDISWKMWQISEGLKRGRIWTKRIEKGRGRGKKKKKATENNINKIRSR
jgi:hypothetical protein